jgi:hypothetical protein
MDDRTRIISLKVEGALDRCSGLLREVKRLKTRYYPSAGAHVLLEFVEKATAYIQTSLPQEASRDDLRVLQTDELEIRMQRHCGRVPFLHDILGLLQGSDVDNTPAEIIPPLRRLIQSVLPGSEVLIASTNQLNYSITEIAQSIRKVFKGFPLEQLASTLPSHFFVITIPQAESDQVLMHGMLSHEAGHGLYAKHKLSDQLLPGIKIDQEKIDFVVRELKQQTQFGEIELRNHVTSAVNLTVTNWARELSSDAFGVHIFGPALLYATIYYMSSFTFLNKASKSHPPARLRIRLMLLALERSFKIEEFDNTTREFLESWSRIAKEPISHQEFDLALASFTDDFLGQVVALTQDLVSHRYSQAQYKSDIQKLGEALVNILPAVEQINPVTGALEPTSFVSILNAGWYVQLARLDAFEKNRFRQHEVPSKDKVRRELHAIIRKSFELSEILRQWQENSHAA